MTASVRASVVLKASLLTLALAVAAAPASAQHTTRQDQRKVELGELPTCMKSLGKLSVVEPEDATDWWTGQQLPAPSKLIKVFVSKSRCFTLVGSSNVGKDQMIATDYVMIPDLISGGNNTDGLDFERKTADVVLTITDVRSTEQVAMAEGSAQKTDIDRGAGGGLFSYSGFGPMGAGGYANTEIGQVITLAYLQAYNDLVGRLGGLSTSNAQQAVTVTTPARLFTTSKGTKVVRSLDPGMILYPTGNKEGMMWEVEDELGNKGWIRSTLIELYR